MSDPKIISFNTIDFPSEAHLQVHLSNIEKRSEELFGKMEQYGLLRATVSQVFNKDGVNRVTWHLETGMKRQWKNAARFSTVTRRAKNKK